jgi:hypothetical protein
MRIAIVRLSDVDTQIWEQTFELQSINLNASFRDLYEAVQWELIAQNPDATATR